MAQSGLARFTRAELTGGFDQRFYAFGASERFDARSGYYTPCFEERYGADFPMIISEFILIMSGSLVIEQIFGIPGVGKLYLQSINLLDYDVFLFVSMFYTFIGLVGSLVIDMSYGIIDPRIRMGER